MSSRLSAFFQKAKQKSKPSAAVPAQGSSLKTPPTLVNSKSQSADEWGVDEVVNEVELTPMNLAVKVGMIESDELIERPAKLPVWGAGAGTVDSAAPAEGGVKKESDTGGEAAVQKDSQVGTFTPKVHKPFVVKAALRSQNFEKDPDLNRSAELLNKEKLATQNVNKKKSIVKQERNSERIAKDVLNGSETPQTVSNVSEEAVNDITEQVQKFNILDYVALDKLEARSFAFDFDVSEAKYIGKIKKQDDRLNSQLVASN